MLPMAIPAYESITLITSIKNTAPKGGIFIICSTWNTLLNYNSPTELIIGAAILNILQLIIEC